MEYLGTDKTVNKIEPLVSICVQTYQHMNFIRECLNGILIQQTKFQFEIIVGEDESTDGTREVCKEYAERYPDKIRLFLRSRKDVIYIDGSPTGRFNLVENIKVARGKYIAICEGDDFWTDPLKLQKQYDLMEFNPTASLCFHRVNIINTDGSKILGTTSEEKVKAEFTTADLLKLDKWLISTCSLMIKKEAIIFPDWVNEIKPGDLMLQLLCSLEGNLYFINEIMANYRRHNLGASQNILYEPGYNALIVLLKHFNEHTQYKFAKEISFKKQYAKKMLVEEFARGMLNKSPWEGSYWSDYLKMLKYLNFRQILHLKYLVRFLIPIK
jgi:glycosyltransferase involved in cell wall biosynthesis